MPLPTCATISMLAGAPPSVVLEGWISKEAAAIAKGLLDPDDAAGASLAVVSLGLVADPVKVNDVASLVAGGNTVGVVSYSLLAGSLDFLFIERSSRRMGFASSAAVSVLSICLKKHRVATCRPESVGGRGLAGLVGFVDCGVDPWQLSRDRHEMVVSALRSGVAGLPSVPSFIGEVYGDHGDDDPLRWTQGEVRIAEHRERRAFGYFPAIRRWYWFDHPG